MAKSIVLIDSDVLINWLTKEKETTTGIDLWKAPYEIVQMAVNQKLICYVSLLSLLEIQFVLRRKKSISEQEVVSDIERIINDLEVLIPDEITLLQAFNLQKEKPLDPFDSILLAQAKREKATLVSRDGKLIELASQVGVRAYNPETFSQQNL